MKRRVLVISSPLKMDSLRALGGWVSGRWGVWGVNRQSPFFTATRRPHKTGPRMHACMHARCRR